MALARLGILIGPKGRGSNMMAIAHACRDPLFGAEVDVVISPVSGSPAVEKARTDGLRVAIVDPIEHSYGSKLVSTLLRCDLICLAGYLRLLPSEVLMAFPNRVLNIHPALLPKFGGKGMYGLHVHEAVLASHETESGCTVHFVSERYDEGKIIVQKRVPVLPEDTPESLAARVLEQEHIAYPEAIQIALERR